MINKIASVEDVNKFINKLIDYSMKLSNSISKRASVNILLPSVTEQLRIKKFVFVNQMIEFFNRRLGYVRETLDTYADISNILTRGLIEIYCHALYWSVKDEHITCFIFQDLCVQADIENGGITNDTSIINGNYNILNHFKIKFPHFRELKIMRSNHVKNVDGDKSFKKLKSKIGFPGVHAIVKNYHNETIDPKIPKAPLYHRYAVLSEQIHANPYYEGYDIGTGKYQITFFIILLYLHFLRALESILECDNKETDSLCSEFRSDVSPALKTLWGVRRLILRPFVFL